MTNRLAAPFVVGLLLLGSSHALAQDAPPPPPGEEPPPPAPEPTAPVAAAGAPAAGGSATGGAAAGASRYATRGVFEIEGGLALGYEKLKSLSFDDKFTFALQPTVRYFIIRNLAVGGTISFAYTRYSLQSGGSISEFTAAMLPGAEYTFNLGSRVIPYATAAFGYGHWRQTSSGGGTSSTASSNGGILQIGGGAKMLFGGGILGVGLVVPITFQSDWESGGMTANDSGGVGFGVLVMTTYGIWF